MSGRPTYIRRDYSKPFFGNRRNSSKLPMLIMILLTLVLIAFLYSQQDMLRYELLDSFDMAPTATLYSSQHGNLGLQYYSEGNIEGAMNELAIAVRQDPDSVDFSYEYGRILIEMVELDKLPDSSLDEVVALGEHLVDIAPTDPRGYALQARALQWSAPEQAIPIAINGQEQDINFSPLNAALAIAYTEIGRYAEALTQGQRAVTNDPYDANAYRAFQYPLLITGRYDQAIEELEQAIAINPRMTTAYFELASLYRTLEQYGMAVGYYEAILDLDPDNAKAYLRICETYMQVGEFQDGQSFCDNALTIDPTYGTAWRALGQIQYSRRNYEDAIESFENCVTYGADEVECYYLRGWAHYFLGQCDQAWDVLSEALPRAESDSVEDNILIGLDAVTVNCSGFQGYVLPTSVPPTAIPPTPIGGF